MSAPRRGVASRRSRGLTLPFRSGSASLVARAAPRWILILPAGLPVLGLNKSWYSRLPVTHARTLSMRPDPIRSVRAHLGTTCTSLSLQDEHEHQRDDPNGRRLLASDDASARAP